MFKNSVVKVSNLIFWLMIAALLSSCSGKVNYGILNFNAQVLAKESQALIKEGKHEEGLKMLQVVKQIHKFDPFIKAIEKEIPEETLESLRIDPVLGFNRKNLRVPIEATTKEKILWYFPDRIKDFVDMVTYEGNVGPQLGLGFWATRAAQAQMFAGTTGGGGYYQKTMVGYRGETNLELVVGPIGASFVAGARAGLGGYANTFQTIAFHKPSHPLYQEYRDYWAVGGKLGFIWVGAEVEIHPVEVVDFLAGLFCIDLLNDDLGLSRRLKYTREQKTMMREFNKMLRTAGKKGRTEYLGKYLTIFPKNTL